MSNYKSTFWVVKSQIPNLKFQIQRLNSKISNARSAINSPKSEIGNAKSAIHYPHLKFKIPNLKLFPSSHFLPDLLVFI